MAYLPTDVVTQEVQQTKAAQRSYSFAFRAIAPEDVLVVLDGDLVDRRSVEVRLNDTRTGGVVRFLTRPETTQYIALADDQELALRRSTAAREAVSLTPEGYTRTRATEALQERMTRVLEELVQQLGERFGLDPVVIEAEVQRILAANPPPAGAPGPAGPPGAQGPPGPAGAPGADGSDAAVPPAGSHDEIVETGRSTATRVWSPDEFYQSVNESIELGVADARYNQIERGEFLIEVPYVFSPAGGIGTNLPDRRIISSQWREHDHIDILNAAPIQGDARQAVRAGRDNPFVVAIPNGSSGVSPYTGAENVGTRQPFANRSSSWFSSSPRAIW